MCRLSTAVGTDSQLDPFSYRSRLPICHRGSQIRLLKSYVVTQEICTAFGPNSYIYAKTNIIKISLIKYPS